MEPFALSKSESWSGKLMSHKIGCQMSYLERQLVRKACYRYDMTASDVMRWAMKTLLIEKLKLDAPAPGV